MKRIILAFVSAYLVACMTDAGKSGNPIDPVDSVTVAGYSLGLGCQGNCLDTNGDGMSDIMTTVVHVGDLNTATDFDSVISFDTAYTQNYYIPDSLRVIYWNNASFMAAIALRAQGSGYPRQRATVALPDYRLEIVGDSCITWNQSAFPDSVPCLKIVAIKP